MGVLRRALDHRAVRGPAAEPRQRDRPPELRDVELVHQPGDRADRAVRHTDVYEKRVYTLPKHLDEKVARLHLDALGVRLTELTADAGRLPRRPGRGPVQARPLPVLARQTTHRSGGTRAQQRTRQTGDGWRAVRSRRTTSPTSRSPPRARRGSRGRPGRCRCSRRSASGSGASGRSTDLGSRPACTSRPRRRTWSGR